MFVRFLCQPWTAFQWNFFFNIRKKINSYEFPPMLYWGFCHGAASLFLIHPTL